MRKLFGLPIMVVLVTCTAAAAATVLFDFETDAEVALWHNEHATVLGADKKLERSRDFAVGGQCSMRFFTPAWHPEEHGGRQKWPAFEGKPPITDWSPYDRLVMEMVNITAKPQRLMLFITDSKVATRSGLIHRETIESFGYVQAVVDLRAGFAARKVNPADIHRMHFFTEDPPVDMTVYLDRFLLLKPGEPIPELPSTFLQQLARLQKPGVEATRQSIAATLGRMTEAVAAVPALQAWVRDVSGGLRRDLSSLEDRLQAGDRAVLDAPRELAQLRARAQAAEARLQVRLDFEKVRPQVQVGPNLEAELVVGFATSMEKVLPRGGPAPFRIAPGVELNLARNETESFQVVALPCRQAVQDVQVRVRDLSSTGGDTFPASSVETVVVGYVETKRVPPYGSPHVGWWPDPILNFMHRTDIATGDAQSFWVRVRAPKDQPAGEFRGKLEMLVSGTPVYAFDLRLRVHSFTMPDASPLPMAITFAPHDHPLPETKQEQAQWRQSDDYPINAWKKHRSEWVDFLADYYITYDSLYAYGGWSPDFQELARLHAQGRLGRFNLGYYGPCGDDPKEIEAWKRNVLGRLRPAYERAKELGILDHAYIYGCDEAKPELFPKVERAAAILKGEFPEVMVMTTTYDHSFGLDSVIQSADAFCPLTPRFGAARAAQARARGKQVWWYICCSPRRPHANMFVEFPAIHARLLMGAMTAKYRPDGFLYYQISIWNSRHPIESGPFTDWDPRSWTTYHGDGSWTCVGPDGTPLPTLRLENFRDGLEDYAYWRILRTMVDRVESTPQLRTGLRGWLTKAREALVVPDNVVKGMTTFTLDPDDLYQWRRRMAEAIVGADMEPVAPW